MPAFVNLPQLEVSPRDFLQAAMAGANQGQQAFQLAEQKAAQTAASRPRLTNLPRVAGGPFIRPESELQKAQAALYLARANEINQAAQNPPETDTAAVPPPVVQKRQWVSTPGGALEVYSGEFKPSPFATPKTENVPSQVPVLIGNPAPFGMGKPTYARTMYPTPVAADVINTAPDITRTNAANQAMLKYLQKIPAAQSAQAQAAPQTIPQGAIELLKSKPELRDKFDQQFGTGSADSVLGAPAKKSLIFMGDPNDPNAPPDTATNITGP